MKYVHTNIIARDWKSLSVFYQRVFGCKPVPPQRDLKGDWLEKLTGVSNAHIIGEHLALPGYGDSPPTLEIFSYGEMTDGCDKLINRQGLAHLAFEVDDVSAVLAKIIEEGGGQLGEAVNVEYPGKIACFVYATDLEGNIIELQNWKRMDADTNEDDGRV